MTATLQKNNRSGERGNVLFLILIAVALFAALSYAVTQSTRSGSGDASGETNLINSAQLAQYPAGVRTSVVRMIIGGASVEQIGFDAPADFKDEVSDLRYNVFHPSGGGAVFQLAPKDVLAANTSIPNLGRWIFTSQYQIDGVGSTETTASTSGNDVIAFLPGVAQNVCKKLNDELGIATANAANSDKIPGLSDIGNPGSPVPTLAQSMTDIASTVGVAGINTNYVGTIGGELYGQPFGCYRGSGGPTDANRVYVYYHVLVER